jgi:hypothetical protein
MEGWQALPPEMWVHTLSWLPVKDILLGASLTDKRMHALTRECGSLWKAIAFRTRPGVALHVEPSDVAKFGWRQLARTILSNVCFSCSKNPGLFVPFDNSRMCCRCFTGSALEARAALIRTLPPCLWLIFFSNPLSLSLSLSPTPRLVVFFLFLSLFGWLIYTHPLVQANG